MFCAKCGAQNDEQSLFCCQCGAQLTEPVPVEPEPPVVPVEAEIPAEVPETVSEMPTRRIRRKRSKKGLWIGLGAGVAGVGILTAIAAAIVSFVVVLAIAIAIIFSNSPRTVAKDYMKATLKPDMESFLDLSPDAVLDDAMPNISYRKQWAKFHNDEMQAYYDYLDNKYGDDWEITYKIVDVEDVSTDTLRNIQERYEERFDCQVKKAKEIELELTFRCNEKEASTDITVTVIKVGSKWYLETYSSRSPSSLIWYLIKSFN